MSLSGTAGNSRNSGYARAANDWYREPRWAVDALLDAIRFRGRSWDPCCGSGNIPEAMKDRGLPCHGTDLIDRGYGEKADFLTDFFPEEIENIVMNPPFRLALSFARRALELAEHRVAILQRTAWLESRERADFFRSTPLSIMLQFSRRVSMPPGELYQGGETGGSIPFAWYVWDKDHRGPPHLGWIG